MSRIMLFEVYVHGPLEQIIFFSKITQATFASGEGKRKRFDMFNTFLVFLCE